MTQAKRKPIERLPINFANPGRMISGTKRGPEGHECVFNANVCTKSAGKIWFGDLDLTDDANDLRRLAAEKNETVYVLREMDARFTTEANPRFENAVATITPAGLITTTSDVF